VRQAVQQTDARQIEVMEFGSERCIKSIIVGGGYTQ